MSYLYVDMYRNREVEYKFSGSDIDVSDWGGDCIFIFFCKVIVSFLYDLGKEGSIKWLKFCYILY